MRQGLASSILILLAVYASLALAQGSDPESGSADESAPPGWPETLIFPEEPEGLRGAAGTLPSPSIAEPFSIGEALYDPSRVDVAVVSLLALMGVGIDNANGAASGSGSAPFRFSDAEVRLMIDMARADAEVASKKGRPPYSFQDVHRAVAPLLPDMTIEQLAAAYSDVYQNQYEALVPMVMLGQPIEPRTRLTRLQVWLLLVDGFVPPATLKPGSGWGTASTVLPALPPPVAAWSNAAWRDLAARLAVLAARVPIQIAPQPAAAHEGHGGPGTTVTLEVRLGIPAAPSATAVPGLSLLAPATGTRAGRSINWQSGDAAVLNRHGTLAPVPGTPTNTDAAGVARINYLPKAEAANGQGMAAQETAEITAVINQWDLVSAYYDLPPQLQAFLAGDVTARGEIEIGWHEAGSAGSPGAIDKIDISITNMYDVKLDMGFLGGGTRKGRDGIEGTLTLQPDGRYRGIVRGFASGTQELKGLGQSCVRAESEGWQQLEVVGTAVGGFGPTHQAPTGAAAAHPLTRRLSALPSYNWISGQPDGGYLSLEFFPTTAGVYSKKDPCQNEIQQTEDPGKPWFLPFNDAQWTIAHAGYGIAVPASGTLQYFDNTSETTIVGTSTWYVIVERGQ